MYAQLLESPRVLMARKPSVDETKLLPFARWLVENINRRGWSVQRVADHADMHVSQLHKIIKSYLPTYSQYQRPGYDKTVAIGRLFNDVRGALESAGYEDLTSSPENADEHTARALLNAGLKAAGFAGLDDEITYIPNPAERTLLERYSNSDEAGRRLIDETAEMAAERAALRASRAGAIGGRAGD